MKLFNTSRAVVGLAVVCLLMNNQLGACERTMPKVTSAFGKMKVFGLNEEKTNIAGGAAGAGAMTAAELASLFGKEAAACSDAVESKHAEGCAKTVAAAGADAGRKAKTEACMLLRAKIQEAQHLLSVLKGMRGDAAPLNKRALDAGITKEVVNFFVNLHVSELDLECLFSALNKIKSLCCDAYPEEIAQIQKKLQNLIHVYTLDGDVSAKKAAEEIAQDIAQCKGSALWWTISPYAPHITENIERILESMIDGRILIMVRNGELA